MAQEGQAGGARSMPVTRAGVVLSAFHPGGGIPSVLPILLVRLLIHSIAPVVVVDPEIKSSCKVLLSLYG